MFVRKDAEASSSMLGKDNTDWIFLKSYIHELLGASASRVVA